MATANDTVASWGRVLHEKVSLVLNYSHFLLVIPCWTSEWQTSFDVGSSVSVLDERIYFLPQFKAHVCILFQICCYLYSVAYLIEISFDTHTHTQTAGNLFAFSLQFFILVFFSIQVFFFFLMFLNHTVSMVITPTDLNPIGQASPGWILLH